jgi:gluconolactonase
MPIEANSPAMLQLADELAGVEQLCTGFQFVEGPIWNAKEQCLYFSDIPGNISYRWECRGRRHGSAQPQ